VFLEIYLPGQFKLKANDILIELPSRPAQSLFAYLVLNAGATLRREKLASMLWCDSAESNARGYLRQALWRIRKSLESASICWEEYLRISEISVTFERQSGYWLDVDQFLRSPDVRTLDACIEDIQLYRGELLPGFYDQWVGLERDRLQTAYFQKMNYLLEHLIQAKRWDEVLKWGEQWILVGYSPEPAYRALMRAYAGMGNPGMIQATYQRCVEALARELDVEPSLETRRLFGLLQQAPPIEQHQPPGLHLVERPQAPPFFIDQLETTPDEKLAVVAREKELGRLNADLRQVLAGDGKIVFVTGEAGSGKTTLLNEFTRRARMTYPDLIVASGNCNAHAGVGDPYLPFREILGLLTGDVQPGWSAGAISKEYAQFLWNLMPVAVKSLLEVGPDLIDTIIPGTALLERALSYSCSEADWSVRLERFLTRKMLDQVGRNPHQSDLFIQYGKLLNSLSRQGPLVLVVDDLQWADLGSISLLFHLGRALAGSRILILGAYRPEDITLGRSGERHPLKPVLNELQREMGVIEVNLGQAESRVFVDAILDCEPNRLSSQFREMLFGLTHGHPLFTIELLRGMQERGDLVQDNAGQWIEGSALDWETLPARVEAVIAERVGRLDRRMQAILRTASLEGEAFTAEVVARVQNLETSDVLRCLSSDLDRNHRLVRAQSIQRIGGQLISTYRFRHILVQKFLYHSLDEVERVHLHERVGEILEGLYGNHPALASLSPQLARHFEEAKFTSRAIHYLIQAGERALQISAYQDALMHLERGLALLATMQDRKDYPQEELSLQLAYGMALHLANGYSPKEMEQAFVRALELCEDIGTPKQQCRILSGLSIFHYVRGGYKKAQQLARETMIYGQQTGDKMLIILGHWVLGISSFALGEFQEANASFEQIADFYRSQQHHRPFVHLRGVDAGLSGQAYMACCLWILGYPDQAQRISQEVLEKAIEIGHAFTLADVLRYGGCEFDKILGDATALKQHSQELIRLSQEKQFPAWLSAGRICLGEALVMLGSYQEGIHLIEEGVFENISRNVRCNFSGSLLSKVLAFIDLGDVENGLAALKETEDLIEQTGEGYMEAEYWRVRSKVELLQDHEDAAEVSLLKAIEIAKRQHALSWELRSALDLAQLWRKQGKAEAVRSVLLELTSRFTEGFDTPDLKQALALSAAPEL
jgi:predicted ATPase/DNA-binding SARP family transcriptional activator